MAGVRQQPVGIRHATRRRCITSTLGGYMPVEMAWLSRRVDPGLREACEQRLGETMHVDFVVTRTGAGTDISDMHLARLKGRADVPRRCHRWGHCTHDRSLDRRSREMFGRQWADGGNH